MEKLRTWIKSEHGRQTKLAAACGVTPGAISQWKSVPVERLPEVEAFTGIPRSVLRPDIFRQIVQ